MFQLFGSLKQFIKPQSCVIDNHIYRLHYKATVLILVAFSLMVTGMFRYFFVMKNSKPPLSAIPP